MEPRIDITRQLEQKKQRLAEMRAAKSRAEDERKRNILNATALAQTNGESPRRQTMSAAEMNELLSSVGVEPNDTASPPRINGMSNSTSDSSAPPTSRSLGLELTSVQSVAIPVKDAAQYSKAIQTDDDRNSVREFSMGSQEFDFDEDMMGMESAFRGRTHSHDLESPMPEELAAFMPNLFSKVRHEEADATILEEPKPEKPRDLTEEEKNQILARTDFQIFFNYAAKVMERALAEEVNIFTNYSQEDTQAVDMGDLLVLSTRFSDDRWTENRVVVGIDYASQHKELVAVAYDQDKDQPHKSPGVICVWNTRFKATSPEYTFTCTSRITSVSFARFHQHLILAGCYSGQICVWDDRIVNKKMPANRSPLSSLTHTQPIFALNVVGTQNAHNLISVSTEGRMCSWNVDNLAQPVCGRDLLNKASRQLPTLCIAFPVADVNSFVAGGEDGKVYYMTRNTVGNSSLVATNEYQGHNASVLSADFHRASGTVDFAHLFLTCSSDWTVMLWSTKDPQLHMVFEAHQDFVFDAKWSPVHPAVFVSADAQGFLLLWNLNENTKNPILTLDVLKGDGMLRKLSWSDNGRQICVGDSRGVLHVFDVHEVLHSNVKNEEWIKFARVLSDVKQEAEEDEAMLSRLETTGAIGNPSSTVAARFPETPRR